MTGGSGGSIKHPPPPDRQLMGHAAILHVLLGAQRVQREARWAAEAATAREANNSRGYSPQMNDPNGFVSMSAVRDCVDRVVASWEIWMNETEKWKADISSLEGERPENLVGRHLIYPGFFFSPNLNFQIFPLPLPRPWT